MILSSKGIRLGPTLPGFLTPGVVKVLVENFHIKPVGNAENDVKLIMEGR
jgi:hydroxylamine reductase